MKGWKTSDEKDFISKLGKPNINMDRFCVYNRLKTPRIVLLVAYRNGLRERAMWGGLNKQEIVDHIEKEIYNETKNKSA